MKRLPQTGIWTQKNIGDIFGDLISSFNLDLSSKQGVVQASPRYMTNTVISGGVPFAFVYNDALAKWYSGAVGAGIYVGGANAGVAFTADVATSTPTMSNDRPDLCPFSIANVTYTYAMNNELIKLAVGGGSWSQIGSIGGATNGAPLLNFKGRLYFCVAQNKMYSSDGASITSSSTYTIDLSGYQRQFINCGFAGASSIYLGTYTTSPSGKSLLYKWDGTNSTPTSVYEVDAQAVLAVVERFGVPWIIDSNGVLSALNGVTFRPMARLPFDKNKMLPFCNGLGESQIVHYNGMTIDGDRILINVNGKYADGTTDENVPSGTWEYNDNNGLFHHLAPNTWLSGTTTTAVDYGYTRIIQAGAIKKATHATYASDGNLLAGFAYNTDNTPTLVRSIQVNNLNDNKQKSAYLTTIKLFSSNIDDTWQKFWPRIKRLLNSTDKIIVKYAVKDFVSVESTFTWASTTTFNTPTDLSSYVGYEIEVISGIGAGRMAHITSVVNNGGSGWLITLDETFTGATSSTGYYRLQNWLKLLTINSQVEDFKLTSLDVGASTWIKFKVWMLFTGKNEVNDLNLINKNNE